MEWRGKLRGFYAVLDRDDPALAGSLLEAAHVLQVRLKGASRQELVRVAGWARRLCDERGALLVVNDDIEAALEARADAVHLGQDDLGLADARRAVAARGGAPLRIGISTHHRGQVEAAVAGGADYLGFGPVFATSTKVDPDPVQGVAGLVEAVRVAGAVPIVAIGGVTPARAVKLAAAGAWAACAISSVNRAADPAAAGRQIAEAFEEPAASDGAAG
ncbi:MAG TPA: thiamine phosphate synthase [Kofleriaceae bacterium]|nr:thiamine phosphate synthase [Kofleriaceae bacterium]